MTLKRIFPCCCKSVNQPVISWIVQRKRPLGSLEWRHQERQPGGQKHQSAGDHCSHDRHHPLHLPHGPVHHICSVSILTEALIHTHSLTCVIALNYCLTSTVPVIRIQQGFAFILTKEKISPQASPVCRSDWHREVSVREGEADEQSGQRRLSTLLYQLLSSHELQPNSGQHSGNGGTDSTSTLSDCNIWAI